MQDDNIIGSGRFGRKPRATLAGLARTAEQDDARAITPWEAKELLTYLSLAGRLEGLTWKQLDAFWDMKRELLEAERKLARHEPAHLRDTDEYPTFFPEDRHEDAREWLDSLPADAYDSVVGAAYAMFKDDFPGPGTTPSTGP